MSIPKLKLERGKLAGLEWPARHEPHRFSTTDFTVEDSMKKEELNGTLHPFGFS